MHEKTEFFDKTGRPIYVGDIVQIRLGKFAKKSNGPSYYRIVRIGKRVCIVLAHIEASKHTVTG